LLKGLDLDLPQEAQRLQFALDQYDVWVRDPTRNYTKSLSG
jgi:hypothetical protein